MAAFDPRRFGEILRLPGAAAFTSAGFLGRLALAAATLAITLAIVHRTGSYATAGLIVGVFVLARAVSAPVLSRLVDRYGQFAVMLIASMSQVVLLIVLTAGIFLDWHVAWLAGVAAVAGLGSGSPPAFVRARWAHLVDSPQKLSTAFAWESLIESSAFTIAPLLVVLLVDAVSPLTGMIFVIGVVAAAGLTLYTQRSTQPPVVLQSDGSSQPVGARVIVSVLVSGLYYFTVSFAMGVFDIIAVEQGESSGNANYTSIILAVFSIGTMIAAIVYGSVQWKWTPQQRLWMLIPLFGIATLAVPVLDGGLILLLPALVIGVLFSFVLTSANLAVQSIAPKGRLTELLSWMTAGLGVGVAAGAYFAGLAVDLGGFEAAAIVLLASGAFGFLVLIFDLLFMRRPVAVGPEPKVNAASE